MKKKILITGAGGFIGRNLKEYLEKEYNVVALTRKDLDLLDTEQVKRFFKKQSFDTVIHCAAHMAMRNSLKDPSLELYNNLRIFFNLSRCAKDFGKMFYFGSGAEYDKRKPIMHVSENDFDTRMPVDYYGFGKYITAKCIQATPNIYNLRLFGCFGPYEDYEIRFISNAICKSIFDKDITIKKNVRFDYLYVKDLGRIISHLIKMKKLPDKDYNVCSGTVTDLKHIAKIVLETSGKKLEVKIKEKGLNNEYSGSNDRLMKLLGKFKFTPIQESIGELYDWYSRNKKGIDKKKLLTDK